MRTPIALSLLLSSSLSLMPQTRPELDLFPMPTEALTIPAAEPSGWTQHDLLMEYGRITGQHFIILEDTLRRLSKTPVPLELGITVEPQHVHSVVETLMVQSDYVFSLAREADPRMLSVQTMQGNRVNLRQDARYITSDELDAWRDHPAFLVHTVLALDHTDVRTLTNSMRAMLTDANTQQIIPVGNSNSLILTGFAPQVAELAEMLQAVNEATRLSHEKQAKATKEEG